jgi:hypothetical protein
MLLETALDPVRKDVLEMMFRMFDREGLSLVPMVEFVSPLPALEARCRSEDSTGQGFDGSARKANPGSIYIPLRQAEHRITTC